MKIQKIMISMFFFVGITMINNLLVAMDEDDEPDKSEYYSPPSRAPNPLRHLCTDDDEAGVSGYCRPSPCQARLWQCPYACRQRSVPLQIGFPLYPDDVLDDFSFHQEDFTFQGINPDKLAEALEQLELDPDLLPPHNAAFQGQIQKLADGFRYLLNNETLAARIQILLENLPPLDQLIPTTDDPNLLEINDLATKSLNTLLVQIPQNLWMFYNIEDLQANQELKTALAKTVKQRFRNFESEVVGHVIEIFDIVLANLSLNTAKADIEYVLTFLGILMLLFEYDEVAVVFNQL